MKQILEDSHITIKGIDSGSVRLLLESSQSTYEKMRRLVRTGALRSILDYPILEVELNAEGEAGLHTLPPAPVAETPEDKDEEYPTPRPIFRSYPPPLYEPGKWFDEFFERERPRLVYYFARHGVPLDISEDLAEEAFLRILKYYSQPPTEKPERFPPPHRGLLYGLAHNVLVDSYRKRPREVPIGDLPPSTFRTEDPQSGFEVAEQVQQMLQALKPQERALLTFRLLDWSYEDIADALV